MKKKYIIIAIAAVLIIALVATIAIVCNKNNSNENPGDSTFEVTSPVDSENTTDAEETPGGVISSDVSSSEVESETPEESSESENIDESKQPEETKAPETSKPEETKTPETSKPEETKVPETSKPEETNAPETSKPEETEPSTPPGTEPSNPPETEPHTHSYGSWTVTNAATCTEKGTETRTCSCGAKETRDIAATGHSYEWVVTKEATTSVEGIKSHKCKVCGNVDKTESIPKIIPKSYHTSWGTRPYEFQQIVSDNYRLGYYFHIDRYGNTWWDMSSSSNGKGKQIYSSMTIMSAGTIYYFGNGRWCGNGYYWDEDGTNIGSFSPGSYTWPSSWGESYELIYHDAPDDFGIMGLLDACEAYRQSIGSGNEKALQSSLGLPDEICSIIESGNYSALQNYFPSGK